MAIRSSCFFFLLFGLIFTVSTASNFKETDSEKSTNHGEGVTSESESQDVQAESQPLQVRGMQVSGINGGTLNVDTMSFVDENYDDVKRKQSTPGRKTPNRNLPTTPTREGRRAQRPKRPVAQPVNVASPRSPVRSTQPAQSTPSFPASQSFQPVPSSLPSQSMSSSPHLIQHAAQGYNIQDSKGQQMAYDCNNVRIRLRSPKKKMNINMRDNEVYVNNRLVCSDASKLSDDLIYQKCDDGAFWYTNLKVGKPMTDKEIESFEKEFKLAEETENETAAFWQKWGEEQQAYWENWAKENLRK